MSDLTKQLRAIADEWDLRHLHGQLGYPTPLRDAADRIDELEQFVNDLVIHRHNRFDETDEGDRTTAWICAHGSVLLPREWDLVDSCKKDDTA
jgi:hypothetical protein